jgi:hypothetical protein
LEFLKGIFCWIFQPLLKASASRNKETKETYVILNLDNLSILKSQNIASVTDVGANNIIFRFIEDLPKNYVINMIGQQWPIPSEVKEASPSSIHIIFSNDVKGAVKVNFDTIDTILK